MSGVISEALDKYGLADRAVLCVEEENADGLFEPIESACINAFDPDGNENNWMNAKTFPSAEADDHSNHGLM